MTRREWVPHAVAAVMSCGVVAVLLATAPDVGFARDEGFYYRAALTYQGWFDVLAEDPAAAVTQAEVDRHWRVNTEHPALMKTLFGLSHRLFHQRLGWLGPASALRLPGMLMAALAVYLTTLIGWRWFGVRAGVAAGLLLLAQPRFFYHAHLACFDVAIAAMWLATLYAYSRGQGSRRWAWATGVLFGVALCTKLNAFFIPPLLLLHHFALRWIETRRGESVRPLIPLVFWAMAVVGPLLFFIHWPWIWHETFERIGFYLGFHRSHPHYNMEYFGVTYFRAPTPITFPFVMTALTVPATTLLLAFVGGASRLAVVLPGRWLARLSLPPSSGRVAPAGADLLVALGLLWPMAIIAWPTVPIFGGTKHWLTAMPMLALLAGVGLDRALCGACRLVPRGAWRTALGFAVALVLLAPAARETVASHPFGLTHYNVLVGGAPGAADAGLNRQFWGFTTEGVIDWLNERVSPGERVFFHDTAFDSFELYRAEGRLRRDIRWGSTDSARFGLVHHEQHMAHVEYEIWERFGTTAPAFVLEHEGVPVISIYERRDHGGLTSLRR